MTTVEKNDLILSNLNLAIKLAKSRKKKYNKINYDELESAAFFGLVQAAEAYAGSEPEHFPSFAIYRILGAIQDYLRELVWGSRRNQQIRQEFIDFAEEPAKQHDVEFFDKIISVLPENFQSVLKRYYIDCEKIQQIAVVFDVHESRISQILSEARRSLKKHWSNEEYELWNSLV